MSDLRKAAQQALEAFESDPNAMVEVTEQHWEYTRDLALDALRAALAQPEPEKVVWRFWVGDWKPLYTAPPQSAQSGQDLQSFAQDWDAPGMEAYDDPRHRLIFFR